MQWRTPWLIASVMRTQQLLLALASGAGRRERRTFLVPTTGDGNVGDQALFEAFVSLIDGDIAVVVASESAFQIPPDAADRVSRHVLPAFQNGTPLAHVRDVVRAGRLVAGADAVAVIGADILDGGYGTHLASPRWAIATFAARRGLPTLVSSMSWNGRPAPGILPMARAAGAAGAVIGARDPASRDRMTAEDVAGVQLTADVVFTLERTQEPEQALADAFEAWRDPARPLVLLNVSALIARRPGLEDEYVRVVEALQDLGAQVALVPHVRRPGNCDIEAADAALPAASQPGLFRVDRLLAPAEVAWFTAQASLVVTGRMHLSILALGQGTPAIVLATQGKVAGLMRSLDAPRWCVDPAPGFADAVIVEARAVLGDVDGARRSVLEHLPAIRGRARVGFEILPRGSRDVDPPGRRASSLSPGYRDELGA